MLAFLSNYSLSKIVLTILNTFCFFMCFRIDLIFVFQKPSGHLGASLEFIDILERGNTLTLNPQLMKKNIISPLISTSFSCCRLLELYVMFFQIWGEIYS